MKAKGTMDQVRLETSFPQPHQENQVGAPNNPSRRSQGVYGVAVLGTAAKDEKHG